MSNGPHRYRRRGRGSWPNSRPCRSPRHQGHGSSTAADAIVLAAYILERITEQSWEAYSRAHIFEPLGMITASFGPHGLETAAERAQPYRHDPVSGDAPVPWRRVSILWPIRTRGLSA